MNRSLKVLLVILTCSAFMLQLTEAGSRKRMRTVTRESKLSYSEAVFKSFLKKKFDSGKLDAKEQIDFLRAHAGAKTLADVINYYWKQLKEIHDQVKEGTISAGGFGIDKRRPEYSVYFSIVKKNPDMIKVYEEWREEK